MANIPGVKSRSWYDQQWIAEVIASVPAIIAAFIGVASAHHDPKVSQNVYGWFVFAAVWLCFGTAWKIRQARKQDREKAQQESPDGLAGCTNVLYRLLKELFHLGIPADTRDGVLRITIHRLVQTRREGEEPSLEQVLPYVGGQGGPAGRRFSVKSGIVGRVIREALAGNTDGLAVQRQDDDYDAFISDLRNVWGYTDTEARALTPDRQAWMAIPMFDAQKSVIGVVYLDSNRKDIFTQEAQTLIIYACYVSSVSRL